VRFGVAACASIAASLPAAAQAEITASSPQGFVTQDERVIDAPRDRVWGVLTDPAAYWDPQHTFSLDAGNLSLEPRAGGCFCEVLPAGEGRRAGSVEHARIIMAQPGVLLRMRGSLGPLQGEALTGTLTVALEDGDEAGTTRVVWTYIVGGYARFDLEQVAPAVDRVQSAQLARLAERFEG
jgi:uncharacterized protein YndB with AHSA1/START domain